MGKDGLSLEEVEGVSWGAVPADATGLVETVHRLRRKPLETLQPGDLRVLLGQQEGLAVLVPRALALLEGNPLLEGDYYPGDVLVAVLRLPRAYWSANPGQREAVERILAGLDGDGNVKDGVEAFRRATSGMR